MIRALLTFIAAFGVVFAGPCAEAKTNKKKAKKETANRTSALGTDHVFSDASVRGKYQYADEGSVTVEDEKELIDLLGMRRHFKDRLDVETTRN